MSRRWTDEQRARCREGQRARRERERQQPPAQPSTNVKSTQPDDPGPRVCVAALVTNSDGRLLLIRHRHRGGWELPGGKVRTGETWVQAIMRETREETGLEASFAAKPEAVLDGLPVPGAPFHGLVIVGYGWAMGEPTAGEEALDVRWFSQHEIPADLSPLASAEEIRKWQTTHHIILDR